MPMGRPKAGLVLNEDERSQLNSIARSISVALVTRARIVLAAAGEFNSAIAQRLQLTRATVGKSVSGSWSIASTGCMTKYVPVSRKRLTMSGWLNSFIRPCTPSQRMAPRTGGCARSPPKRLSRQRVCTITSSCWACNRIAAKASSSRRINSSSRNCVTWSACT